VDRNTTNTTNTTLLLVVFVVVVVVVVVVFVVSGTKIGLEEKRLDDESGEALRR